ncbi:unnamed protein product [Orchesella dallaii]|uniref:G-protein coupled receptors family 1 profile domain-containing protein n=1 Tax=Orchesella dallaii TaxID=48710 RepID=A0ABP1R5L8_9HEXA
MEGSGSGSGAGRIMHSDLEYDSSGDYSDKWFRPPLIKDYVDQSVKILSTENDTFPLYFAEDEEYSLYFKIAIVILFNSVFVTALVGNALVIYIVFSRLKMRTATNYLIANLAMGDLLMTVSCVPFVYLPVIRLYWPFGTFLCYLLPHAQSVSLLVSSYTLVALAVDRYMQICYPFRPQLTKSQTCSISAGMWIIALITAFPIAIFKENFPYKNTGQYMCDNTGWKDMGPEEFKLPYGWTLMTFQYYFPVTLLIFTYSRIKSLRQAEAEDSKDQSVFKTKSNKMLKMMMTVSLIYIMSWLPHNIFIIYEEIWVEPSSKELQQVIEYLYLAFLWLAMAHTVWKPVIYCFMDSSFRDGFKEVASNVRRKLVHSIFKRGDPHLHNTVQDQVTTKFGP